MHQKNYDQLKMARPPKLPRRFLWMAALQIGFGIIWRIVPLGLLFWVLLPMICILGWMASFGYKTALREFRFWLDQITREEF